MMTFKDLKKLVELPSYKEQRVPTVKALEVSGVPVVAEKILENHGSISVYQNGYVIYRAHKRVTVFSLRNCVHYKYDALEGAGHHIEEEEFDEYEWHIRLVLEGEDRIFMNYEIIQGKWMPSREDREYRDIEKPIKSQGNLIKPSIRFNRGGVSIGDDTWIGTNVVIVGTVEIGKHCVIGANSVVTHDIPDYCVAAGSPCKVLKRYNIVTREWERNSMD